MTAWRTSTALAVGLWGLACAGVPQATTPESVEPHDVAEPRPTVEFTVPADAEVLVQTLDGLWTADGTLVAELGGAAFQDVYLIDATTEAFFLLSDSEHTVRVAQRRGGSRFVVTTLLEDTDVVRPVGPLALVRPPGSERGEVIDPEGNVVLEDAFVSARGEDPPVEMPEYWWIIDYFQRPAPLCGAGGSTCGWFGPDGRWWVERKGRQVPAMLVEATWWRGLAWYNEDGEVIDDQAFNSILGDLNDGLALVGVTYRDGDHYRSRSHVWDAETGQVLPTELDVVARDAVVCRRHLGGRCRHVFHEGVAAVAFWKSDAQAYVTRDGTFAFELGAGCDGMALSGPFRDGRALHCDGNRFWLIDKTGNHLAGPYPTWEPNEDRNRYPNGLFFADGLAAVPVEGGGWSYIDRDGVVVLPGPYDVARPFRLGFATVKQGDKISVINKKGEPHFVR